MRGGIRRGRSGGLVGVGLCVLGRLVCQGAPDTIYGASPAMVWSILLLGGPLLGFGAHEAMRVLDAAVGGLILDGTAASGNAAAAAGFSEAASCFAVIL